ncbi:MAG TPA: histidine kinase dimerization/phosphoacceptor domain -containing protein [Cyclobacteriaceae bacterium]
MIFFRVFFLAAILSTLPSFVKSQPSKLSKSYILDSLNRSLRLSKPDSTRVLILLYLSDPEVKMYSYAKGDVNLDTASYYLKRAESLSDSINYKGGKWHVAMKWAYVSFKRGELQKQKEYLLKAVAIGRDMKSTETESIAWHQLSSYHKNQNELEESIRCLEENLRLARLDTTLRAEGGTLATLARRYMDLGNNELAMRYASEAMVASTKEGWKEFNNLYFLFAEINEYSGNYAEALRYIVLAIESVKEVRFYRPLCTYYLHLGLIYDQLEQPDEALLAYEKALQLATETGNKVIIFDALHNAVSVLIKLKRPERALQLIQETNNVSTPDTYIQHFRLDLAIIECDIAQRKYAVAEKTLLRILKDNNSTLSDKDKIILYCKTSDLYSAMGNFGKARIYLDKSTTINSGVVSLKMAAAEHLAYFKLDSAQGNFLEAIKQYQKYKYLNDSIFNDTKSKQIASLQIQFETKEKEKNIDLLKKENEIQQASLQQKEFERNAFIVGGVLLLMVIFFIYNRFRIKQRTNLLLESKQVEINAKNQALNKALIEKDFLIADKESLLKNKDLLLEEKEWLLKEIHHRVKNNLQVITGLLTSQAFYLEDGKALSAIQESQHRVHAMSLIHQKLYQSDKMESLDIKEYIQEVVEYLTDAFRNNRVDFNLDIDEIKLDAALAVPLGLLVNEALTNCLKYAFDIDQNGKVSISLKHFSDQTYSLTISDNGRGLPDDFDLVQSRSLGMSLMNGLSNQLGGTLVIENRKGLTLNVLFTTSMINSYATQANLK